MFEGIDLLRYAVVFMAILGVLGAGSFALRWIRIGRFGGGAAAARRRQPRLGVTEFAAVGDGRRRLFLIRRDTVEHLVMTGGPTDVVIESNIVRASVATPVRESAPARATPDAETGGMWPPHPEPSARPTRAAAAWEEAEPDTISLPVQAPPRVVAEREGTRKAAREAIREPVRETALRLQGGDRIAGHAADLRSIAEGPLVPPPRRGAEPRRAPPQPVPPITMSAEQNLAEMAQRLESALQRPRPVAEPPPVAPPVMAPPVAPPPRTVETVPAEPTLSRPELEPGSDANSDRRSEPESEPKSDTKSEPTPASNPAAKVASAAGFDSLEQEMASLLGRPAGKT